MPSFDKKFYFLLFILFWSMVSHAQFKLGYKPRNGANIRSRDWVNSLSTVTANLAPSQYLVFSVTGSSQVLETEPVFGFPTGKLYTFKLCITHPTDKTPLRGAEVIIEGGSVPLKPQGIDDSCASWTESFNYLYTAPARYVTIKRTLVINRSPIGESIPFQFAINPWLHGESSTATEIADFIKIKPRDPVPASQSLLAFQGTDSLLKPAHIIANDARVNFQELGLDSKSGGHFLFDIRLTPQIELVNAAGQLVYVKMAQGDFEFEAFLLSTLYEGNVQVRRIVNNHPLKGEAHLRDGALTYLQDIVLPAIPSRGRLELAIALNPKQTKPYLDDLKTIYILGDYTELKSNLYARLKPGYSNSNESFDFADYVGLNKSKNVDNSTDRPAELRDGLRRLKYEFEPLTFKLTRIGEESATARRVYYQVRACVKNGTDNTPLRAYHFNITKGALSGQTEVLPSAAPRVSEYDSCIYWDDHIDHKYYASQKYYRADFRIQNSELNFDETLSAYINPWEISLSRDSRTIEVDEVQRETLTHKGKPFLFIPTYKIQTRTIKYTVDPMMRLKIKKDVHLLVDPMVLNYSDISRGIDSRETIRDGLWKIRWAVLHNRYESATDPFVVLSRGEQITVATEGRIVTPLSLDFDDFRYVDSRNYLLLEIAPVKPDSVVSVEGGGLIPNNPDRNFDSTVDRDAGLDPQTFIGPLLTGGDRDVGYLIPHPYNPMIGAFVEKEAATRFSSSENAVFEKTAPTWETLPPLMPEVNYINKDELNKWINRDYLQANNIQSWNLNEPEERINLRRHMGPSPRLLQIDSRYRRSLFTTEMLTRAIQRRRLTAELEDRLCFYYFDQNPIQSLSFKSHWLPWRNSNYWLVNCLQSVDRKKSSFFRAQLETPINRIDSVQFAGTMTSSLSVGSSFSVTSTDSKTNSTSVSAAAQIGLSHKFSDLLSIGGTATYTMTHSESEAESHANGLSVGSGVNLNVRKLTLNLKGIQSQNCITAQLDPNLYSNSKSDLLKDTRNAAKTPNQAYRFLTQKVRLCYGDQADAPFESQEDFYFVTQDTVGASFIDDPDLRNRPLLLQLRGKPAYQNFINYIGANVRAPEQTNNVDEQGLNPAGRMQKAMQMMVPGFPGLLAETLGR